METGGIEGENIEGKKNYFSLFIIIILTGLATIPGALLVPNYGPIMDEMELTYGQMGLIDTIFIAVAAIVSLVWGYASDSFQRKKLLYILGLTWSGFTALTFFADSYIALIVFRCGAAVGAGGMIPVAFSLISDLVPSDRRSKTFAAWSVAIGLGAGIGALVAILFENWRFPFILIGIIGLIGTQATFLLSEPERGSMDGFNIQDSNESNSVTNQEEEDQEKTLLAYNYKIKTEDLAVLWEKRTNFWLLMNFVNTIPAGIILYWLITFLERERGMNIMVIPLFGGFLALGALGGTVFFGSLGDRLFSGGDLRARSKICIG